MRIGKTLIVLIILVLFINIAPSVGMIQPDGVSNLDNVSYETSYINWSWKDPSSANFTKVMVYVDGIFKKNVSKGIQYYNATGFSAGTVHSIGTITVNKTGNMSVEVNDTKKTKDNIIRFITIGDAHITSNTSTDQYNRLTSAINSINNRTDVDFVVQIGDIGDSANGASFTTGKSVLDKLSKKYYVVEGNHDIGTAGTLFKSYFGPTEHVESVNNYQLIFVGIKSNGSKNVYNTTIAYDWSFDYSSIDKNKPTIIFSHGPVQPKNGGVCGDWDANANKEIYFSYACSMKSETDKFNNLLGYYAGHVHSGTNQIIGNTLYVTEDNLGGNGADSDFIGYTTIKNGVVIDYKLLNYSSDQMTGGLPGPVPTASPTATATASPTATVTASPTATATASPTATATASPTATAAPVPIQTSNGEGNSGSSSGSSSGGGSGGGGGGLGTAEPYANMYKYEVQEHAIFTTPVLFKYVTPELGIYDVSVTSMQSNIASLRIEVLKDTSKLVGSSAGGIVYKNVNAWINYERIKNATIRFRVENSWMNDNGLSADKIKMSKWNNVSKEWIELSSIVTGKDGAYTYFDTDVSLLSGSYAMYGKEKDNEISSSAQTDMSANTKQVDTEKAPELVNVNNVTIVVETESPKAPGFNGSLTIGGILLAMYIYIWKKKL